jgi:hypothetical protein
MRAPADAGIDPVASPSFRSDTHLQEDPMHKILVALAASLAVMTASAQIGKAASEATDAAKHKIDEKRADSEARKSGPVGKAVNNVKSGYHKNRSQRSADKAKKALKDAG